MKFIQNEELREWVKDNLKKTIFQKAHALAVQTGCDILVKLQDNTEHQGHQYYATQKLQKAYINNALRKHPCEMQVSGETGSPLVNQAGIQMGDNVMVETGDGAIPSQFTDQTSMEQNEDNLERAGAVQVKIEALCDMGSMNDNGNSSSDQRGGGSDLESYSNNALFQTSNVGMRIPQRSYPMSQSPKLYQCALCQKSFRSIQILQMHSQTFHLRTSSTFSPSRSLIRNKNRNSRKSKPNQEDRRYACSMCERTFFHQDLLKDHMSRSHMGGSMSLTGIRTSTAANAPTTTTTVTMDASSTQNQMGVSPMSTNNTVGTSSPVVKIEAIDFDSSSVQMNQDTTPMKLPHTESFLESLGQPTVRLPMLNLPSSSAAGTSMFSQSPGTTPFRFPASGAPIKTSSPISGQAVEHKGPMPTIKIMKAILAIGGPVSTANTVKDNLRNRNYDRVTNDHFLEAANNLKELGLGHLVSCKNGSGRLVDVFIKKPPEEVLDIIQANSALCDPAVYISTFAGQTPVRLMRSSQLMENLIASGLVAQEHLKMHTKPDPIEMAGHNVGSASFDNYNIGQFDMHAVAGTFDTSGQQGEDLFDVHSLMDAHNIGPIDAQDINQVDGQQNVAQMNTQGTDNAQAGNDLGTIEGHNFDANNETNVVQNDGQSVGTNAGNGQGVIDPNGAGDNVTPMEDIVNLEP